MALCTGKAPLQSLAATEHGTRTQGSLGSSRVPGQHAVPVFCLSELNILILRVVRGCWISPRLGRVFPLKVVFSALTSVYGCLFWDEMS